MNKKLLSMGFLLGTLFLMPFTDVYALDFPTGGEAIAVAIEPSTGNFFVFNSFEDNIREFNTAGTEINTIPRPGASSDDFGLDFIEESVNVGGTVVPAGTLLVFNGDDSPEQLYALNPTTGAVLDSQVMPSDSLVGGAYHETRNTIFTVDWEGDDLIREINPETGAELNSFAPGAGFTVNYGGIEVSPVSGNLFLVSDDQNMVRELTPTGVFVADADVNPCDISEMSGAGFDNSNVLFVSSNAGMVLEVPEACLPRESTTPVGGEFLPIETTSLLLASAQSFSWMIPLILSGIGIGLFVVSRKSE